MSWTLLHGTDEKTFAEWGLKGLKRTLVSQSIDEVEFTHDGAAFDDDALFPENDFVTIKKDGAPWFWGRVVQVPRIGDPGSENLTYRVAGPWWFFENKFFHDVWHGYPGSGLPENMFRSHCMLNLQADGSLITTKQQIIETCQFINDEAQLEFGLDVMTLDSDNILPGLDLYVPPDEARSITCAEVMRRQVRFTPDVSIWFDYSTSPPTIHVARRASLVAVDMAATGKPVNSVRITPRHDLVRPSVIIRYEITNTLDGVSFVDVQPQVQPGNPGEIAPEGATGREFGALAADIDLRGWSANIATARLIVNVMDTSSLDWWKSKLPWLTSEQAFNLSLSDVTREQDPDDFPRELHDGQVASWMDFNSERETIKAKLNYSLRKFDYGSAVNYAKITEKLNEEISVQVTTTDAPAGDHTYRTLQVTQFGEPIPVGLAQALYDAVSVLHFDGQVTLIEQEVGGEVGVGNVLNLTGGKTEWETMRAQVQQITEYVDNGTTEIAVGPPKQIGPDDIIELLRFNRSRLLYTHRSVRSTGKEVASGELPLGDKMPIQDALAGAGVHEILKVAGPSESTDPAPLGDIRKKITLDAKTADPVTPANNGTASVNIALAHCKGKPIQLREYVYCIENDDNWRILLLGSEPYRPGS